MTMEGNMQYAEYEIQGKVQRVNFRDTVWDMAYPLGLKGRIWNDDDDPELVHLQVEGTSLNIDELIRRIKKMKTELPSTDEVTGPRRLIHVDKITKITRKPIKPEEIKFKHFIIVFPDDPKAIQKEILYKLSYGNAVYTNFHEDHNHNFQHLDTKFGAVTEAILQVGTALTQEIKPIRKYLTDPKDTGD